MGRAWVGEVVLMEDSRADEVESSMEIKVPRPGGVVEETSVVPTKARGTAGAEGTAEFMGEMDVPAWSRGCGETG